jgi:hypothetical protein
VKAALVNTPQGRASAHPEAARDFANMAQQFKDAGAPIKSWGSYNPRKKRWGNDWSSHAYAASWDINNVATFAKSPEIANWIRQNPDTFKKILRDNNMRQPLADASMAGGKDAPHIEWTGPGTDDANRPQTSYAGGGQSIPGLPKELQTANAAPAAATPMADGGAQTPFAKARRAAAEAGIKDPDTAAAIAMYESGNFRRGHGGIFDRSGGTNPFGQTVKRGTPGAIIGADGQPHAVYGSLTEGFADHKKKWGDRYADTPEATVKSFTTQKGRGSYNSVNPAWASNVLKIRKREVAKLQAEEARLAAAEAAKPKTTVADAEKPKTRSFTPDEANNRRMEKHREEVKALKGEEEKGEGALQQKEVDAPAKTRPSDDLIMASQRERDVNVNLKVNDSSMQFARASMRRSADREVREARWNSHSDIGAA